MPNDEMSSGAGAGNVLPLDSLPKTVLQAIYHTVTGKTENLSKTLRGNVYITTTDVDRLFGMLIDQLHLHHTTLGPTVTVVIKHANEKAVTYSSWERYKTLGISGHEVTSDLTLKLEFVLQLPQTPGPQRCTVNVNLDSSLPVIYRRNNEGPLGFDGAGLLWFMGNRWPAVEMSIDFVDFLIARSFSGVVEEWFSTLTRTPTSWLSSFLLRNQPILREVLRQTGRLGMAAFLGACVLYSKDRFTTLAQAATAVSLGLAIWAGLFNADEWR